ncbi:uncharacterized protein LOC126993091 [Eriocheir sinensis]|uniref:uncharacterized protein LOC126993091 n=1 Tax=Eriocheir sinensis TaxID=95602 RepID=UPI0021C815F2|nr:uncharacterized protein LOC126993091 [Eriocheir sinensis]
MEIPVKTQLIFSVASGSGGSVSLRRLVLQHAYVRLPKPPRELLVQHTETRLEPRKKLGSEYESLMEVAALSASPAGHLSGPIVVGGILAEGTVRVHGAPGSNYKQKYLKGGNLRLLSTPLAEGGDQAFLTLSFTQVNRKSLDFQIKYGSSLQHLHGVVSQLKAHLQQSGSLSGALRSWSDCLAVWVT